MRFLRSLLVVSISSALTLLSHAEDLGTVGPTYDISEPHLLQWIEQRLLAKERSGDLRRLQDEAKARAIEDIRHPAPLPGLTKATAARTFFVDPSVTLTEPIRDEKGRVLFPAGTRKNPFEIVSMSKHLLFFDARDERQVEGARRLIDRYQGRVKPILVAGSYLDLMKRWKRPVYFDQHSRLVKKLGIAQVPALVSQDGLRLRIDILVL
jgi:conjugal transfer pilus assembly protein TraW